MTDNKKMPNQEGYFGKYGGRYVAETLVPALEELSEKSSPTLSWAVRVYVPLLESDPPTFK